MTKKKIFFSVLFYSVFAYSQKEIKQYDSAAFFTAGQEQLAQKNYIESADSYNQVHYLDSSYPEAQYERILSLIYADKRDEALAISQKLYDDKLYEKFPPLLLIHSILLSDLKDYDGALTKLTEAEILLKNSANLNYNKAIIYVKLNQKQKAVDLLKTNLQFDPVHQLSLLNLGLLALEDGQIVEGSLFLMTYLLFNYNTQNANEALVALNKDFSRSYVNKPTLKIKEGDDDFAMLEEVLRNKFPYNKKFPLLTKYDEYAPRNMQAIAEYFKDHKIEKGYFETKFGLLFKYITDNNLTKAYLYTTMSNSKNLFQSEYSKNEKEILAFQKDHISPILWSEYYNTGILEGEKYHVNLYEGDKRYYYQVENNKVDGKYLLTDNFGIKLTSGFIKNDMLNGVKTTFQKDNNILSEESFSNGKKIGISTDYYPNSQIRFQANFKDNAIDGKYTLNYITQQISCTGNYKMDQYDGEIQCFYPTATLKLVVNYKEGKFHGPYKKYNEIGEITEEVNYVNNQIDGNHTIYYAKDKIKSIDSYKNGVPLSYVSYFIDGSVEQESTFKDGKLDEIKSYHINKSLKSLRTYNTKEELVNIKYYNSDGDLFFEEILSKGTNKQSIQYYADGRSEKIKNTGFAQFRSLNGDLMSEGQLKNGSLHGDWTYYHPNQVIQSTCTYVDGVETGTRKIYLKHGSLDYIAYIESDRLNGFYKDYFNDKIMFDTFYKDDLLNGPFTNYYTNGGIKNQQFYINNALNGLRKHFNQDGSLYKTIQYIDDQIIDLKYHFGGKTYTLDYTKQEGTIEIPSSPVVKRKISIKGGIDHGSYEVIDTNNDYISRENYANNKLHGKIYYYHPNGQKSHELNYHVGNLHGTQIEYDLNGMVTRRSELEHSNLVGIDQYFYPNGKVMNTKTFLNNVANGVEYYYNTAGQKIVAFHHKNDELVSYQVLDKTGNLGDPMPFNNSVSTIISKYANENPAIIINYAKSLRDGSFVIYSKENKKEFEKTFKYGYSDGITTYYLNNLKYMSAEYDHGVQKGTTIFYDEKEQIKYSTEFANDEKHGYFKAFKDNVLIKTKKYDSDILVEIL